MSRSKNIPQLDGQLEDQNDGKENVLSFLCDTCDFKCNKETVLIIHKSRKHKEQSQEFRETDSYWNSGFGIKTFK